MDTPIIFNWTANRSHIKSGEASELYVAIDVKSPELGLISQPGKPINVCITLDTSGSMADEMKLERAKQAALHLCKSLDQEDIISLITFDGKVRTQIESENMVDISRYERILNGLKASGTTALYDALETSNEMISKISQYQPDMVNRIILLTDGQPTKGKSKLSDFVSISRLIEDNNISVIAIGIGSDYNEDLLTAIATHSDGLWYHVTDPSEISMIFSDQLRDMKTVIMTKPKLIFTLMSGAEISGAYKVRPMLNKLEETHRGGNVHEISLSDIVGGKEQNVVFNLTVPPRSPGEFRIAKAELISGSQRFLENIAVTYTDDPELFSKETNPYPRLLLSTSESTVLLRDGISEGDETKIREAQTKIRSSLSDEEAQTVVHKNPLLTDIATTFRDVVQETRVKGPLTDEKKKEIKSKTTVIRRN